MKDETALGMLTYNVHAVLKPWFKNNLILDSILRILSIILKEDKLASIETMLIMLHFSIW